MEHTIQVLHSFILENLHRLYFLPFQWLMESNIFLHLHGIFFNQFKEERELMETGLEDRLIEGGQHTGKGGGAK